MLLRAALATAGCAALVATTAVSAEASSAIQFSTIRYNSPGTDRATNASVNGEYAIIKNYGSTSRSLTGWTCLVGGVPRDKNGEPIDGLINDGVEKWSATPKLTASCGFSQKPRPEGYNDFHEKVT